MFSRFEKGIYLRVDSVDKEACVRSRRAKSLQVVVIQNIIFFSKKKSKNNMLSCLSTVGNEYQSISSK